MGSVYRGWDPELGRAVALKRLRDDRASNPDALLRLRREARAVAQLNHPSIAQVYDVLEVGGTWWIVLELVEGRSIVRWQEQRSPHLSELLSWFRQIAEGLSAAHDQGVLHRDLKHENVLVRPDGRVKILDFGLAKSLHGGGDLGSLTAKGQILGTFRAMSPEQLLDRRLDARSDLFSLGVLIYEALAGDSPFQGQSTPDTVRRILSHQQRPLFQVAVDVPRELSILVDQLLSKAPEGRPRGARQVADLLAESEARLLGDASVTPGSVSYSGIEAQTTLTGSWSPSSMDLPPSARPRPWILFAGLMVTLLLLAGALSIEQLAEPVLGEQALGLDVVAPENFEALVALRRRYIRARDVEELRALEQDLRVLGRQSPELVEVLLLRSGVLCRIFGFTRNAEILEDAFGAAVQARSLAPSSIRPILAELRVTVEARRVERSGQLFQELDRRFPKFSGGTGLRALWLSQQGRTDEAVELLRDRVSHSGPSYFLLELGALEIAQGDFYSARSTFRRALREDPDNSTALASLAQVEMMDGRLAEAAGLYGRLLRKHRDSAGLSNSALVHQLLGRPDLAVPLLEEAVQKVPYNASVLLNLADAERVLGRSEIAREHYLKVLELSEMDPVEQSWQRWTTRAQASAQLGWTDQALDALNRAQSMSDRAEVSLEAAVVLATLGRDEAALDQLRSALKEDGGLSRVWLELPALKHLKSDFWLLEQEPRG